MENTNNNVNMNTNMNNVEDQIVLNGTIKLTFKTTGVDLVETSTRKGETTDTFNGVDDRAHEHDRTKEVHLAPTESSITLEFDETAIGYGKLIGAIGQMLGNLRF